MTDIQHLKTKLQAELSRLESELSKIAAQNPNNPLDWQATNGTVATDSADENEVADVMEEFETNTAIVSELEKQYDDVQLALEKIEKGNYGICEISGHPIEDDRLEVNPAARTCKAHINEKIS